VQKVSQAIQVEEMAVTADTLPQVIARMRTETRAGSSVEAMLNARSDHSHGAGELDDPLRSH